MRSTAKPVGGAPRSSTPRAWDGFHRTAPSANMRTTCGISRSNYQRKESADVKEIMQALFIGQTYIDVTFLADHIPAGDEKSVASEYAVSFGGNAVTAAFCCAKLGIKPDLIATLASDWLGRMFVDMAKKYEVRLHERKVGSSSLSFIVPKDGKR